MAERSITSSEAAGWADFCRAIKRMGMLVGVARSAAAPGTNENPVMAPPELRLTSAVICCHRGLATGLISSPHFHGHVTSRGTGFQFRRSFGRLAPRYELR